MISQRFIEQFIERPCLAPNGVFLVWAASVVFLVYAAALLIDLLRGALELGADDGAGRRRCRFPVARTTPGRFLFERIAQLKNKVATVSWEITAQALHELKVPDLEWWRRDASAGEASESSTAVIEKVHRFIEREFRSIEQATLLIGPGGVVDFIGAPLPARLSEDIAAQVEDAFRTGQVGVVIAEQAARRRSLGASYVSFGVAQSLLCAFEARGTSPIRGAFWLGYSAERPVTELEAQALKELARKVELYFETFSEVISLSQEVQEVHSENSRKSDFIAHMSHDIRSPLNNIKAILTLFRLETDNREWIELSEAAMRNCDGLGEIVEDLLDYSRHRAGRLDARREPVEIGMCVEDVIAGFAVTARLKGVRLRFENFKVGVRCEVDKKQLRRMLGNLINNALKYTSRGEVTVILTAEADGRLGIRIRDTGAGMNATQLQSLFTPFARFQPGIEGVGLGLVVTKILAELNQGRIEVRSEEGKGSEFCLSFVMLRPEKSELSADADSTAAESTVLQLLLVDDEPDCVESMARILEREGLKVIKCYSVEEAIGICNFEAPDVLITDSTMPQGGGERLVRFASTLACKPAIAVLSGEESAATSVYKALGVEHVFRKPIELNELLLWLRSLPRRETKPATALAA